MTVLELLQAIIAADCHASFTSGYALCPTRIHRVHCQRHSAPPKETRSNPSFCCLLDFEGRERDHTSCMRRLLPRVVLVALASTLTAGISSAKDPAAIEESVRAIPVLADVDVVVVGGASHGVAVAAQIAAGGGAVYLVAREPYLGEDICATRRLWLQTNEIPATALGQALFPSPRVARQAHAGQIGPGRASRGQRCALPDGDLRNGRIRAPGWCADAYPAKHAAILAG